MGQDMFQKVANVIDRCWCAGLTDVTYDRTDDE